MKNKLILLTIVLAALLPMNIFAQPVSIWDGTSEIWTQGQGTESNPYLIENAQQLAYIAETVNGGVTHYDNTYFKLTTSVYIDSTTSWEPIGLNQTYYFGGHFDGDNHLVTLYLTTSTHQFVGVFGYAKNGSISNLNSSGRVTRTTASSSVYAGGICGYSSANITNCHNSSDVSSSSISYSSTTFPSFSGGVCGYSSSAVVTNCYNTGNVLSSSSSLAPYSYSGGICGYNDNNINITNCHNTGNVSSFSSVYSSSAKSYSYSGGICGYNYIHKSDNNINITNCHNTGNVSSSSFFYYSIVES